MWLLLYFYWIALVWTANRLLHSAVTFLLPSLDIITWEGRKSFLFAQTRYSLDSFVARCVTLSQVYSHPGSH